MKKFKEVNSVHDKTLPPKLERGKVVTYQLLIGKPNPDETKRAKYPIIYPSAYQIPSIDRIWDANKEAYVDIAYASGLDRDGNIIAKSIIVGRMDHGIIGCHGGKIEDEEKYEYLELSNFNASNDNRDPSIEPLFKRIDDKRDAGDRSKKRYALRDAMNVASSMTNGEVEMFVAAINWETNVPMEILRDQVEAFAQADPDKFLKVADSKDMEVKAIIKGAISAGKISYDPVQHRIALGSQTLIKLERVEGVDWLTQAAEFCLHGTKGTSVLNNIKKLTSQEVMEK